MISILGLLRENTGTLRGENLVILRNSLIVILTMQEKQILQL